MNCILDWQFIPLKPINLVKCIFLTDGHKCVKFYILMHKYIADIVFKYIKKIYPPFLQSFVKIFILPNFYFLKKILKHFREIFSTYKLFLNDAENSSVYNAKEIVRIY